MLNPKVAVIGLSFVGYTCLLAFAARVSPVQEHGAAAAPAPPQAEHGAPPQRLVAYPPRPKAPQEVLDRGKAVYSANCAFCHGSDAGGGAVGPNLLRSSVVLGDQNGELIAPIVHGSRRNQGMPAIPIEDAQITDIAAWLHSLHIGSGTFGDDKINIVTGDAKAGEATFTTLCGSCHSVKGDLKGFATRFPDPKVLQQTWLMPSGGGGRGPATTPAVNVPPVTATVSLPDGETVDGILNRIDDFSVELTPSDGKRVTIPLDNGTPHVELHDPLAPHRELLHRYTDKQIHDITAYLVTIQ